MKLNTSAILRAGDLVKTLSVSNLENIFSKAKNAYEEWSSLEVAERIGRISKLHEIIKKHRVKIVETLQDEVGKPEFETLGQEIIIALRLSRYYQNLAPDFIIQRIPKDFLNRLFFPFSEELMILEPYGVWGMIPAWNGTLQFTFGDAIPALLVGNTVIAKPSEYTPKMTALMQEMVQEAGLEKELTIIHGASEEGSWLVDHCDAIHFTGSSKVGKKIQKRCEEREIPFVGEMGGFDPMIVFPDAQLERAVNGAIWGRFDNAGQNCNAVKIVYYIGKPGEGRAFAGHLVRAAAKLKPTRDYGPVINEKQFQILQRQTEEMIKSGAECLTRENYEFNKQLSREARGPKWFFRPIILYWEDYHEAPICKDSQGCEETFGPILQVTSVPREEEVIKLVNNSPYALGASIWTHDDERVERLVRALKVGNVCVRIPLANYAVVELPFGGRRLSGTGRRHGSQGMEVFGWWKSVLIAPKSAPKREKYWFPYGRYEKFFRFLIDNVL